MEPPSEADLSELVCQGFHRSSRGRNHLEEDDATIRSGLNALKYQRNVQFYLGWM